MPAPAINVARARLPAILAPILDSQRGFAGFTHEERKTGT
jgi:hypothetical protein